MRKGLFLAALLVLALAGAVLARAPQSLTIFINGFPMTGKALFYKDKIYVPLEDVARSTGGTYSFDEASGTARVTVGAPAPTSQAAPAEGTPYVKVTWERKYLYGTNAKVVATLSNRGEAPARNLEVTCIFKDGTLNELNAVTRALGTLAPGESRTVEFILFDSATAAYPTYGYYNGYYYYYPAAGVAGAGIGGDKINIGGHWTWIFYELRMNYQ